MGHAKYYGKPTQNLGDAFIKDGKMQKKIQALQPSRFNMSLVFVYIHVISIWIVVNLINLLIVRLEKYALLSKLNKLHWISGKGTRLQIIQLSDLQI